MATTDGEEIKIWDILHRKKMLSVESTRTDLHFSPGGRYFAASSPDGVLLYDLSREPRLLLDEKTTARGGPRDSMLSVAEVAFREQGREIVFAHSVPDNETWTLKIWETATGRLLADRADLPGYVDHFAFKRRR